MTPIAFPNDPDQFPGEEASFALSGPAGKLETISNVAEPADARRGVAVICHPNPVEGGTMHNKVVTMVERSLRERGLDTVRFNFRGTGASEGSYDEGNGNGDDLAAVVARYADRVAHVQIADAPGRHEPGTGELDLDGYLSTLQANGYAGYVGLEYKPTTTTEESLAWLPRERRASA